MSKLKDLKVANAKQGGKSEAHGRSAEGSELSGMEGLVLSRLVKCPNLLESQTLFKQTSPSDGL